ncbi:ABC transporter ATP-binding protein [Pseudobacillus badius]|uniref:ABC transporter ATP-binding protein n=1 Tax=Bacillus badius TaxID=1455 RepID=UPI001CBE1D87|nr:ABC transporter ATP-binding protein [Bacillus badius]UAT29003.1 ABC transporter ATP-binding protein [Bacillus badius]GLY12582.1 ABC transporter ATP-binding protein [Bacillus badius]
MEKNDIIVNLREISKFFGKKEVLSNINLTIRRGESVGIVGPNGAGKTTLISMIQGIKRPTSGIVKLFGGNPSHPKFRTKLGVSPQSISLPETFKAKELIDFVRKHYLDQDSLEDLIEEFKLTNIADQKVGGLSGGQKRLLSACLSFSGNPELVLLDEPTAGLDMNTRDTLWEIIKKRHLKGTTVIVTSHYSEDIENLAQRIVKIDNGEIHLDESLSQIRNKAQMKNIVLKTKNPNTFVNLPSVESYSIDGEHLILKSFQSEQLIREIVMIDEDFQDLKVFEDRLDQYFMASSEKKGKVSQ